MGGPNSGRKKKEETEFDFDAETTFDEKPITEKKTEKKTHAKKFSMGEVQEKINLVFSAVAKATKRKYSYTEKDFSAEAAALVRLTEKFPILFNALSLFDPVLLLLGFWAKYTNMDKKDQQQQQPGNVVQMQQQAGVR